MRFFRPIAALVVLLAAALPVRATSSSADLPHVHVQLVSTGPEIASKGLGTELGLYFKLEPGWHIYWKNPGDAGEPPHVKWTMPEGVSAGPLQFPAPRRLPLGPLMDYGYEDEVIYPAEISVAKSTKAGHAVIHAKVDWLVCRATCIPEKADLELQLLVLNSPLDDGNTGPIASLFSIKTAKNLPEIPKEMPKTDRVKFQATSAGFILTVTTGKREIEALFFPADPDIIDNPAPQTVTPTAKGLILDLKKDANLTTAPAQLRGVIELSGGRAFDIVAQAGPAIVGAPVASAPQQAAPATTPTPVASTPTSPAAAPVNPRPAGPGLLQAAGLAFIGGLLLNLMPCVFPVLFLKGLALVQSGNEERHKLRMHGFVYAAGILVSFWVLVGALQALRAAGSKLGWGFQFQSPIFLMLMAALLFFLGLSLAGQFEIGLTLTSAGGSLAQKQGYTGSFFTGVLAVIVATPCTAPFMGAAVGYALAQSIAVSFTIFTALALGLAAPYVALTLQPAWTRVLPRPGAWMEVLKQAVSVMIFGTVIWLAWVVASAYGATMLAALLVSFLLLAVAGWFLGRWPAKGWSATIAVLLMACVVALSIASKIETDRVNPQFDSSKVLTINLRPLSAEDLAHQTSWPEWSAWSKDKVATYLANGRPVFVDFTAKWCLSCQVNERVALGQPEVQKAFADANVGLLRADWTQHDDAITQALSDLGRSGVPTYVLYVPGQTNPQVLPEVLTPGIITDAIGKLPHTATQTTAATSNP